MLVHSMTGCASDGEADDEWTFNSAPLNWWDVSHRPPHTALCTGEGAPEADD